MKYLIEETTKNYLPTLTTIKASSERVAIVKAGLQQMVASKFIGYLSCLHIRQNTTYKVLKVE